MPQTHPSKLKLDSQIFEECLESLNTHLAEVEVTLDPLQYAAYLRLVILKAQAMLKSMDEPGGTD